MVPLGAEFCDGSATCPAAHHIHGCYKLAEREQRVPPLEPRNPDPAVDHPAHYGGADDPYEAIKVIEAWHLGFCLGNAIKYIARAGRKGDVVEDLKKARWYLDRQIAMLETQRTKTLPSAAKLEP